MMFPVSSERPDPPAQPALATRRGNPIVTGASLPERDLPVFAPGELVGVPASPTTKAAILKKLYAERAELNRKQRLDGLEPSQRAFLTDLNQYIDSMEAEPQSQSPQQDVWAKLNELAGSLVSIQARVEANKK